MIVSGREAEHLAIGSQSASGQAKAMGAAVDDQADKSTVNITVLAVTPARTGRLFALASVAIDIGGVSIELHGIRALRIGTEGTRIELPQFRDAAGLPRAVITLPPEICQPIGDVVLDALVERGLAKRLPPHRRGIGWQAARLALWRMGGPRIAAWSIVTRVDAALDVEGLRHAAGLPAPGAEEDSTSCLSPLSG